MRVFYRAIRSRRTGLPATYQQGPVKFCCVEMCRRWGTVIGLGARGASSTDRAVNLYLDRPQANGRTVLELVPVEHCPWCGEPVETVRIK
jgi:hypothetical protein